MSIGNMRIIHKNQKKDKNILPEKHRVFRCCLRYKRGKLLGYDILEIALGVS